MNPRNICLCVSMCVHVSLFDEQRSKLLDERNAMIVESKSINWR
jgi:hypothetical protein